MAGNPNPRTDQIEPYQWGKGQSGNPKGMKPGTKHISTWIDEMLHEEVEFKVLIDPLARRKDDRFMKYKGIPIRAIIGVAILKALQGDKDAREWLAKYGYGEKQVHEFEDPIEGILSKYGLRGEPKRNARKVKTAKARSPKNPKRS